MRSLLQRETYRIKPHSKTTTFRLSVPTETLISLHLYTSETGETGNLSLNIWTYKYQSLTDELTGVITGKLTMVSEH